MLNCGDGYYDPCYLGQQQLCKSVIKAVATEALSLSDGSSRYAESLNPLPHLVPFDPEAIKRFLEFPGPRPPQVKGASQEKLLRIIYDSTGKPFRPPDDFHYWQLEGLAFALYCRRALLFFSMRLGKTYCALQWMQHLRDANLWRRGKGLIIAHSPVGLHSVWLPEAQKRSRLKLVPVRTSPEELCAALEIDCDAVVIPWSGLQTIFSAKGVSRKGNNKLYPQRLSLALAAQHFSLCVFDEIHYSQNEQSLRFAIAQELTADCNFRLGLTGTPVGRRPFSLWSQTFLIDRGKSLGYNYYFFQEAFGQQVANNFQPGGFEWVFDHAKMPILQQKLAQVALAYKFEEVRQVTVLRGVVELDMGVEQAKLYAEVVHESKLLRIGQTEEIANVFSKLRQISSGFVPFTDENADKRILTLHDSAKLRWLEEFGPALNSQAIIFHDFVQSSKMICDKLKKLGISYSRLYGGTSEKQRDAEISKFQRGETQIFVANSVVGGAAIELGMADYLVFWECPLDPRVRQQAEARPMSRTRPLALDDLVCSPIERRILEYIAEGKEVLRAVLKDPKVLGAHPDPGIRAVSRSASVGAH